MRAGSRMVALAALGALGACSTVFDGDLGPAIACGDEGAFGPPACPEGETCISGSCAAIGAPLGASCKRDDDCAAPAFCLDPGDVGQSGDPRCSRTCCTSSECGDPRHGQVCWSPPDGAGSLCWPAAALGRSAIGDGRGGDGCDAGCRSGLCVDGACADGCCQHANCSAEQICRIKLVTELAEADGWVCGKPGSSAAGTSCDTDDDCPSSRCIGEPGRMVCVEPCCGSAECGERLIEGELTRVACDVIDGHLRGCSRLLPTTAIGGVGAACDDDLDCRSGQCLDGYCSDLCCRDESCGDTSAFSCLPAPLGGVWALRCVRK